MKYQRVAVTGMVMGFVVAIAYVLGEAGMFAPDNVVRVDTIHHTDTVTVDTVFMGPDLPCRGEVSIASTGEQIPVTHVDRDGDGPALVALTARFAARVTYIEAYRACTGEIVRFDEPKRGDALFYGEE